MDSRDVDQTKGRIAIEDECRSLGLHFACAWDSLPVMYPLRRKDMNANWFAKLSSGAITIREDWKAEVTRLGSAHVETTEGLRLILVI